MGDRALSVAIRQTAPVPLDVTFTCGPGDVLGIYGPSGSGKTTILRTIAGLHRHGSGVVAAGRDVWMDTTAGRWRPAHERHVGFVFQEYALFPHLTALGNVRTALGHRPAHERHEQAQQLLAAVQLADKADRRPAEL